VGLLSIFLRKNIILHGGILAHLGFSTKFLIDLNHALKGFNRHEFWRVILGQNVVGKFQP
jgi:hypothetical protein